ncbi:MAG: hypothetical protein Q8M18_02560, partial [Bradyrhizobium sp.]|nr:hypothetical protein [Bradyrhizobium sp.]
GGRDVISINASNECVAMLMSNSSNGVGMQSGLKRKKAALCGCGLLENVADPYASALSSDTARPIIVERATTESGAGVGPGLDHGAGPYS